MIFSSLISVYDLITGISCVQFDDSRIVSGSSDKTIKVGMIHRQG